MVDVFLFRHAHVDYTPPAQITAYNPLTPLGHKMAARLAERCDEWDLQYLFVSTMLRAQQTADAISERFPALPRADMPEFEEVSLNYLSGYPKELPSEDLNTWKGEHFAYGNARMWECVTAGWAKVLHMIEEKGLERVAIVSHGGPLNALLRRFLGGGVVRLRTCWFGLDWSSTTCLRYNSEGRWIRWVNDARHIDGLRRLLEPSSTDT